VATTRVHVASIASLALPVIELRDGGRAHLAAAHPRAGQMGALLGQLQRRGSPVYLEVDAATAEVVRLLIPHVSRVTGLRPGDDGGLDVTLEPSAARHRLRSALPTFAVVAEELRRAMATGALLVVTEDDAHDIVHARPFVPGADGPQPPLPPRA
jgi:hypothetical protein